jgi:hypothetical protein
VDQPPGTVGQRLPYQRLKAVRIDADGGRHDLPPGEPGTEGGLPVTDVGKPAKVPPRLDATRRAVSAELRAVGLEFTADRIGCELLDGRPLVSVPHIADRELRLRVATALDRYTFRWEFAAKSAPWASDRSC